MNYYFLGIGGIGMSAIARFFHQRGDTVSGYDRTESPLTRQLVQEGIAVHYDDDPSQIPDAIDLVVYTPAPKKGPHTKTVTGAGRAYPWQEMYCSGRYPRQDLHVEHDSPHS